MRQRRNVVSREDERSKLPGSVKGLLHYPTCRVQLEVSAWSEVGRTLDLPQMTDLEAGSRDDIILKPAVFDSRTAITPI